MVRISDARMSGTAFGTVVLHVAPEAAAMGPLAAVEDGDEIVLDIERRRLDLALPDEEIKRRLRPAPGAATACTGEATARSTSSMCCRPTRGPTSTSSRAVPDEPTVTEPLGLLDGWIGGW